MAFPTENAPVACIAQDLGHGSRRIRRIHPCAFPVVGRAMRGGERGHCIWRDHACWIHLHTDSVSQGIEAGHQADAGGSACGGRVGLCEFHAHGGKRLHIGSDVEMIQIICHRVASSVVNEGNRSVGHPHVIHEKDDDVGAAGGDFDAHRDLRLHAFSTECRSEGIGGRFVHRDSGGSCAAAGERSGINATGIKHQRIVGSGLPGQSN